jgi:four helix bundle protein
MSGTGFSSFESQRFLLPGVKCVCFSTYFIELCKNHSMPHPLGEKSYHFALHIIGLSNLLEAKRAFSISNQLLRSGTSIGANVEEAQQAQSRADFISKYSIALKEAVETEYWLRLIQDSRIIPIDKKFFVDAKELQRLLTASIKTAKSNSN